jgi:hypothetical protein
MMIPQRLTSEPSNDATALAQRPRAPGPQRGLVGLRGVLACSLLACSVVACTGTIDNNEQSYSLVPNGTAPSTSAAPSGGAAPAARTPTGATTGSEQVGDNISGLDDEGDSDDRQAGGSSRRRASDRDRDEDEDEENEDAGVEEPLEDAGVLDDAGVVDGGVELDGGVAADGGSAP